MKKYSLITFAIFLFSVLVSLINPPKGPLNSDLKNEDNVEEYTLLSNEEILHKALQKNYNAFDNFSAQYKNTVLSWFGKSRNLEEFYITEELIKEYGELEDYFINLGKILPYLLIIISLFLFLIPHNKEISK
jgi:hypothetical protein